MPSGFSHRTARSCSACRYPVGGGGRGDGDQLTAVENGQLGAGMGDLLLGGDAGDQLGIMGHQGLHLTPGLAQTGDMDSPQLLPMTPACIVTWLFCFMMSSRARDGALAASASVHRGDCAEIGRASVSDSFVRLLKTQNETGAAEFTLLDGHAVAVGLQDLGGYRQADPLTRLEGIDAYAALQDLLASVFRHPGPSSLTSSTSCCRSL